MSTATQAAIQQRPDFGRLYGITYNPTTKAPIVRAPRVLKVGLGIPKGRAIQVFLLGGKWHIRHGIWEKDRTGRDKLVMKTVFQGGAVIDGVPTPNTREAAEAWHHANKHLAVVSNRPQKVPYFTFTRRTVIEEGGKPVEVFEPDFDAIEAHGDTPKRIPVVLTSDNPLHQEFSWWSASELKCHGDGLLAERAISAGSATDPGWQEAKAAGQKMFLYSPCFQTGCPHAGVDCKQHSTLNLQLAYALRLGTTAYFASPGEVSAGALFSSLFEIKESIQRLGFSIAGAPMDLVLGSFRANHEGKPSVQPYVSLELRAEGVAALRRRLHEDSWTPMELAAVAQIAGVVDEDVSVYEAIPTGTTSGDVMGMDAVGVMVEPDFDDEEPEAIPPAASATQRKQSELAHKLQQQRVAAPVVVPEREPAAPEPMPGALEPEPPVGRRLWASREEMMSLFTRVKQKVGDPAFDAALRRHKVMMGTLDWNDPAAALLYADLIDEGLF